MSRTIWFTEKNGFFTGDFIDRIGYVCLSYLSVGMLEYDLEFKVVVIHSHQMVF